MFRRFRLPSGMSAVVAVSLLVVAAAGLLLMGKSMQGHPAAYARLGALKPTGYPQLVSIEPLQAMNTDGEMCQWVPASSQTSLVSELQHGRDAARGVSATAADGRPAMSLDRPPLRTIRDQFPTYSTVALDTKNNEIVLQEENLFQIMVYDRMANTPPSATMTEPKRVIGGTEAKVEFNCGLYVDPMSGDIYSVNNDTLDTMSVFSRNAKGNVRPDRQLHTPHGTYGIAVDEEAQELFLTVQHENEVVVYHKDAQGEDKPIRTLEGAHVRLADPHGIAIDTKNNLMFVGNQGSTKQKNIAGSGKFVPPSINIYPLRADGDTAPLRVLEGPHTQLNWPAHLAVDREHGELYVANDAGDSILVFHETDNGDIAPTRVLKGSRTQIKNPTGVVIDTANDELVVANMGNHRATVYHRTAAGDAPPIRTIRSAAEGIPALQIGNPGAVAYDTKRDEIIVPN